MKLLIIILNMGLACLTACSKSKPIESAEVVGEWQATRLWTKEWGRSLVTGSIVFRADGTLRTIDLPWGVVTGNEAELTLIASVSGRWKIEVKEGMRVVYLGFEEPKNKGRGSGIWIDPELKGDQWTFRQYIGDPDLMDIVEFKKRAVSPPDAKR